MSEIDAERRYVLSAIGGGGAVMLAGCLDVDDEDVAAHTIVFLEDGESTEVEVEEDQDVLEPALDAGVDIPNECLVGRCGLCTARYDGDANEVVEHDGNEYLSEEQIDDGWLLTCVAFPQDGFEAEVDHPDPEDVGLE